MHFCKLAGPGFLICSTKGVTLSHPRSREDTSHGEIYLWHPRRQGRAHYPLDSSCWSSNFNSTHYGLFQGGLPWALTRWWRTQWNMVWFLQADRAELRDQPCHITLGKFGQQSDFISWSPFLLELNEVNKMTTHKTLWEVTEITSSKCP